MAEKTTLLIVDDASVFRITLKKQLQEEKHIEVVGLAKNGEEALEMIKRFSPDIVILDLEMPVMDGLRTLEEINKIRPRVKSKVVMFSSHTLHGAEKTLKALSLGAVDFVAKPSGGSLSESQRKISETLIPLVNALADEGAARPTPRMAPMAPVKKARPGLGQKKEVVGIGISTGGPEALAHVFPKFALDMACPILLVQHMPPIFTRQLAEQLNSLSSIHVKEAEEGEPLKPGWAYVAPGNYHMTVELADGKRVIGLNQKPPVNSCRPAADVLFKSLAQQFGGKVLGIVMTGIGQDGLKGCAELKQKGAAIITQDKETCVVYGMPRFVNEANLADETVPLDDIADRAKLYLP